MDDLAIYRDYVQLLESELYSFLTRFNGMEGGYYDYLLYHFGFKTSDFADSQLPGIRLFGKRLRPVLCFLIYEAITGNREDIRKVIPLVLSAEIMHNASLIHDDIQDHDELRWGRPTVWKLFGMEQGINCGDTLQALAYHSIFDLSKMGFEDSLVTRILSASNRIHLTVIEGQFLDLLFEKRLDISEYEYFKMISKKTAAPFAGIAECTAALATKESSDSPLIASYRDFALKFGMLFQLTDDILGIWGDVWKTGKTPADVRNKKKTLPIIHAFNHATEKNKERLIFLYSSFPGCLEEEEAEEVLGILEESGSRNFCLDWAERFYKETIQALEADQISNSNQEKLRFMVDYCFRRSQAYSEKRS